MNTAASSNTQRELVRLIKEIGASKGYSVETASTDWILEVSSPAGQTIRIFGYDFGANPSSAADIARDKAATSHVLKKAKVPCVDHQIVFNPNFQKHSGQPNAYGLAYDIFQKFGGKAVCKDIRGTGGEHVYKVDSLASLEQAMASIFATAHACTLSPFLDIKQEIRVIMVDGEATALFSKQPSFILGDGTSTVAQLIATRHPKLLLAGQGVDMPAHWLAAIPSQDEAIPLHWKHNLGQGASPVFDIETDVREAVTALAAAALRAMNLRAASVDVVLAKNNDSNQDELMVLEVNGGIMAEGLTKSGDIGRTMALRTYEKLLNCAFKFQAP